MSAEIRFFLRPNLLDTLAAMVGIRRRAFLVLSPAGLEVRFPLGFRRKQIPWVDIQLFFAIEKPRARTIYAEFTARSGLEYILEEIDDERSSLEINRELFRWGYLRGEATPEELEAARKDRDRKG